MPPGHRDDKARNSGLDDLIESRGKPETVGVPPATGGSRGFVLRPGLLLSSSYALWRTGELEIPARFRRVPVTGLLLIGATALAVKLPRLRNETKFGLPINAGSISSGENNLRAKFLTEAAFLMTHGIAPFSIVFDGPAAAGNHPHRARYTGGTADLRALMHRYRNRLRCWRMPVWFDCRNSTLPDRSVTLGLHIRFSPWQQSDSLLMPDWESTKGRCRRKLLPPRILHWCFST